MNRFPTIGIIPARYASTRFPGKPLVDILGKTMICRVYEQASASKLDKVYVATDDHRIADEMIAHGAEVIMTSPDHPSGTDRCAEVIAKLGEEIDERSVIINIQGDEPFIDPDQIDLLVSCFEKPDVNIATLVRKFSNSEDILNPNTIKVVKAVDDFALYFSRSTVPFERDGNAGNPSPENYFQHIGLYGYRAGTLATLATLAPSKLELAEKLEQLRWLENGYKIMTALSDHESWSVDSPEDLEKMLRRFS